MEDKVLDMIVNRLDRLEMKVDDLTVRVVRLTVQERLISAGFGLMGAAIIGIVSAWVSK